MNRYALAQRERGWTLLELSIVLLAVGFIIATIIRGEEMILQARIKSIVADFNALRLATSAYQDRYIRLPGDDDQVSRWNGTGVAPVPGNANGTVEGAYDAVPSNPPTSAEESNLFWWHLRLSGILVGPIDPLTGPRQPGNFVGGLIGVQSPPTTLGAVGLVMCSAGIPARAAAAVDLSTDEGHANAGDMRGLKRSALGGSPIPATTPTADYDEASGDNYVLCRSLLR